MKLAVLPNLSTLSLEQWNALELRDNPFVSYAFLNALEEHGCVGGNTGWIPQHLVITDNNRLIGALPMYLKDHSWGEFVFDWAWANAYQRSGLNYYPKLVASVPFSPVSGPRLLVTGDPRYDSGRIRQALIEGAIAHARQLNASSLHCLFTDEQDTRALAQTPLAPRLGYQFHWTNRGYGDFDDFLSTLSSAKRKKIKRERRRVAESTVEIRRHRGGELNAGQWRLLQGLYAKTCEDKHNMAWLTPEFFQAMGRELADNSLVFFAYYRQEPVAGAFFLRSRDRLYGRYWGCLQEFHSLHFETCYYQALDYCIAEGINVFEPGAQGEHKISRGFLPTATWSCHWLDDARFSQAMGRFLKEEKHQVRRCMAELMRHSPYKRIDERD